MVKFISTWVLVADAARARIFKWSDFQGPLEEVQDLLNPEGRLKDGELASERPGVSSRRQGTRAGAACRRRRWRTRRPTPSPAPSRRS
jgi:hypothetical protein